MTLSLHHFTFKAMACLNEIFLYSESKQKARDVAERAIESVNRLEHRYSRYIPSSILSKINASAGDKAGITVDQETASLLDYANTCYQHSDGLFHAYPVITGWHDFTGLFINVLLQQPL